MQKFSKKKLYYGLAAGVVLAAVAAGIMIKGHSKSAVVMEEVALVRTAVVENAGAAQNYIYSGEVKGRLKVSCFSSWRENNKTACAARQCCKCWRCAYGNRRQRC